MPAQSSHKSWHSRGYLPHFDHPGTIQYITFRLADSVPAEAINRWRDELDLAGNEPADDPRCTELLDRIETRPGFPLGDIVHSWKSFTAKECNRILQRQAAFWMPDYFDRYIRNPNHLQAVITYIAENPVKAHLCPIPSDWPWSHAGIPPA